MAHFEVVVTLSCDTVTTTPCFSGGSGHFVCFSKGSGHIFFVFVTTTPRFSGGSGQCVARQSDHYLATKTENREKKISVGSDGLAGWRRLETGRFSQT